MPDTEDETFEGIDLLDPTKLVPEELCPVELVAEMFRHFKAIGVASDATDVLTAAGVPEDAPGVVVGEPAVVVAELAGLLATHRVWERFPATPPKAPARKPAGKN